jgi:ferric-dicitrate binding protein FerR (iron transport regulator)
MNLIANCKEQAVRWSRAGFLMLSALGLWMGLASNAALADDAAGPARAVRLASVDGQVRIAQGVEVLADQAVANTPLFEGTRVVTQEDGRAEIQLEDGSVARLSPNSALTLAVLRGQGSSGEAEIVMENGLGYFEVQGGGQAGTIKIRFGGCMVTVSGYTVLRVNLDNPPGELAVFSGNAHLERGSALAVDLHGGESVMLNGSDAARYELNESIEPDSWDSWNSDRDQMLTAEAASKTAATKEYADSGNPAWNDLDANGSWYSLPGQGNIWSPYAASDPGFDPYGSGYWMWTPRFGYIWVSNYSWGYMPFQCGMWNYYDSFGWGWMPGMGGCMPWWGGLGGGYMGPNIGIGFGGYRPPLPPHRRPRPISPGGRFEVTPLVAVNRRPAIGSGAPPLRNRTGAVVIAGQTVQPIRPLNPRPVYDHSASAFVNRTDYPGASGGAGSVARTLGAGGAISVTSRQGSSGSTPGSFSSRPESGSSHNTSASSHSSSGGVYAGGGSVNHSSGGGGNSGGGSASHSSGGGGFSGGGGGGASHGGGGSGGSSSGGGSHR